MPRLFDSKKRRNTYALLMSLSMSGIMSFALGFARLGLSWETAHTCLLTWPLAFLFNYAAVQVVSPLMRRLTILIHPVTKD